MPAAYAATRRSLASIMVRIVSAKRLSRRLLTARRHSPEEAVSSVKTGIASSRSTIDMVSDSDKSASISGDVAVSFR